MKKNKQNEYFKFMLVFMLIPSTIWRCGQVVKTLPFHGRIAGPTPASVTIWESRIAAIAAGCKPVDLTVFIGSSPISPTNIYGHNSTGRVFVLHAKSCRFKSYCPYQKYGSIV